MSVYRLTDSDDPDADIMNRCVWQGDLEDPDDEDFNGDDPESLAALETLWGLGWTHDQRITAQDGAWDRSGEGLDRRLHNLAALKNFG